MRTAKKKSDHVTLAFKLLPNHEIIKLTFPILDLDSQIELVSDGFSAGAKVSSEEQTILNVSQLPAVRVSMWSAQSKK